MAHLLNAEVQVELLDSVYTGIVVLGVVLLEYQSLLGCGALQSLYDQPAALVVLYVGTNLANHLRATTISTSKMISKETNEKYVDVTWN